MKQIFKSLMPILIVLVITIRLLMISRGTGIPESSFRTDTWEIQ